MRTLVIDAPNLVMRSVHALAHARVRLVHDQVNTGPLMVTISTLSRYIREVAPDRVVVCWDGGRSAHRTALDPAYKANRADLPTEAQRMKEDAFEQVREFLSVAGIHQVQRRGYEADDLIAAYWRQRQPEEEIVILSSDKDLLQLLGPYVRQIRLSSGGAPTDYWDAERVRTDLGIEPEHLAKAMALSGDDSDNIPGVPRFGLKTAVKHLAKHGYDLDAIDHEAVVQHRDRVRLNLALVDLRAPLTQIALGPVPSFRPTTLADASFGDLVAFLNRYQLRSIAERLYAGQLWYTEEMEKSGTR